MEYVVVRCGCGALEQVPVHPAEEFVRFEATPCAACTAQPPGPAGAAWGGLLGLTAMALGVVVGLSQWVLLGKPPRAVR